MLDPIEFAEQTRWDAVIVGTGVGGATLGHALARAGWRVLFCESGRAFGMAEPDAGLRGSYAELSFPRGPHGPDQLIDILKRAGRCSDELRDLSGSTHRSFVPFIGSGAGGSSALYGMAMERFHPADFRPRSKHPNDSATTLPDAWPITYVELEPYYAAAERLYRVKGGGDPLRPGPSTVQLPDAPPLSTRATAVWSHLESHGLHPYRLPMACEFVADCMGCQGYLCPRGCKNDSARICLVPAVSEHRATLLDRCNVRCVLAAGRRAAGIEIERAGRRATVRGGIIVLAAGALMTPCLLLKSASAEWPQGLANGSGQVGRNLMRHLIDLYALAPRSGDGRPSSHKEIAFNDYYDCHDGKWGSVQSFGSLPPVEMLMASLRKDLSDSTLPWVARLLPLVAPIIRPVLTKMVEESVVLASIVEDLPYAGNHVWPADDGRIELTYRLSTSDRLRVEALRKRLLHVFGRCRPRLIKQAHNNERIAHACGTCRFGTDPETSVLDLYNRAHEVENLYVVDASFFPSSGGTNPALTIAANALRVADSIVG